MFVLRAMNKEIIAVFACCLVQYTAAHGNQIALAILSEHFKAR